MAATIENYFVCVGAQKAGTTWIANLLSAHPEIFVTPVKEVHYFDQVQGLSNKLSAYKRWSRFRKFSGRFLFGSKDFEHKRRELRWFVNYLKNPIDDDWYVSLFPSGSSYGITGEFTPEYALIGAKGFKHIKRLAPDAKVLFLLRRPLEQAWSQYLHFRDPRNDQIDVNDAIRFWQTDYSMKLRNYAATIRQLYDAFGASHVHIGFYEDLKEDTSGGLQRIYEFLAVSPFDMSTKNMKTVYNKSPNLSIDRELADYLDGECLRIADEVEEIVGHVPAAWAEPPPGNTRQTEPNDAEPQNGPKCRERPY